MAELVWGAAPSSSTSKVVTVDGTIYGSNTAIAFVGFNTNSAASSVSVSHSTQGSLTRVGTFQTGNGSLDVFTIQNMVAGDVTASWSGGGITSQLMIVAVEDGTAIADYTQDSGSAATISIAAAGTTGDRVIGYACARFPDYAAIVTEGTELTGAQQFANSFTVNATGDDYSGTLDHGFDFGAGGKSYCARSIAVTVASSTSITPTDTTPDDASLQTITCSGMTGPLTAASEGGLDVFSGLSGTDPSVPITFTVDVSATEASTGMPRIGETSTISFTTATDGAVTTDVTMQPKANWTTVTLAGTLDKTANGFLDALDTDLGVISAVGDIIYYSNARGEAITATGVYTGGTTVAYQSTEFVIQQGGSATVAATSEGGQFYPFGEAPASSGDGPAVKSINISSIRIGI